MEENNNQVMSDSDIVASIEVYILFGAVVSTKSVNPKYIIDFGRPMETYQYFIFPNYFRYKSENEAKASGLYWWADELKKRGAKLNTYSMANIFIFTIIGLFLFSILAIIGLFLLFLVFS